MLFMLISTAMNPYSLQASASDRPLQTAIYV